MKKIFALAFIAVGFAACNNQADNKENADTMTMAVVTDTLPAKPVITYNEGDVSRRDGKVVVYKNGQWAPIEKDVTLEDGTTVTVKGEARSKDGKVYVIEDGYYVTRAGRFFDRTGAAIENAWDKTKEGVKNAAEATKDGVQKAGEAIKEGAEKVGDKLKADHDRKVEDVKKATGN